ncbi:hypothetical protein MAA_11386 [Metarhizium robertsii ARSEF 23]|uniref:Ketosynthase family 3 (KS3) domain-containing protein n=2 Tax=Metarhizium robertsii (strain ARSEF 23 / ATCC MYA-3075) TaxID=655844 RepID=A0A0B2XE25_METRA|nr:uncharacterized protein MAA_11386 [Metarhizium robertsii ARSEF 23]KHO10995.1 hypothetical protein MAA_11386 [Metarhizium robertsii ARSEF 23]
MQNSRTAHAKVPEERWHADAWYHPDPDRKGSLNTTHGFFLEQDVAAFDAPFFSVTAKEAAGMDPAKRLVLEVSYEAFENAGLPMDKVAGTKTGVYVGSMTSDYELLSTREIYDEPHMAAAGSSEAMTANRVSWFFDLRGPSLTLDTACSSSLYALHLACQSLRLGETNMALVAGVSVVLHPNFMQQLVAMHMLSPDDISHTFDDRANGYGRGEGLGGLVIKRLGDAIRDGDTIRAVIRGSGTNVDGKTPSVTMPSPEAQADLIRDVYRKAGLPLDQTQYIELHGTGTPVGDPIELSAIAATFGACRSHGNPVHVGSIKPNVGHTEGCAGLAGVFKAIMCLEKGVLLPTAEVGKINPKLRFADWNIVLPAQTMAWPTHGPRRVSVNSFGFGGANAHIILDDAHHYMKAKGLNGEHSTLHNTKYLESNPASKSDITNSPTDKIMNGDENGIDVTKKPKKKKKKKLFIMSSRDEPGIQRLGKSLGSYWKSDKAINDVTNAATYLSDVAYTLATRRSLFDYRSFVVAESTEELVQGLEGPLPRFKRSTKQNRVAFVFTGQGAQWAGMGRQLIEFPTFAASVARSKACLESLRCPFDVETEIQQTEGSKIESSEYSQPICTVVQIALVDLLREWDIRPKAVVGHSSAAAYAAEILSHEDAVKVAFIRGVYSGMVSRGPKAGAMLAAGISEEEAEAYLATMPSETVVTACVNSPKSVTLSGDAEFVDILEQSIAKDGNFARKLRVVPAYHSPHMRMVADDCLRAMVEAGVGGANQEAKIPMFYSLIPLRLASRIGSETCAAQYDFRKPSPVNLLVGSSGRRAGRKATVKWDALLEVGPHAALKAPLVQIMESIDAKLPSELLYTSLLVRKEDAVTTALKAVGSLWATGIPILLAKVNREQDLVESPQVVVDLPSYAWNHERVYWHETPATKVSPSTTHAAFVRHSA